MDAQYEDKLRELRQARQRALDTIQRARMDLDRIDFAISILDGSDYIDNRHSGVTQTREGSIQHLGKHIVDALQSAGHVMTASEIRTELYTPDMDLTPEQLRRRISVKTSAMHKVSVPPELMDSGRKNAKREIYWALPEWVSAEGRINLDRIPDEIL